MSKKRKHYKSAQKQADKILRGLGYSTRGEWLPENGILTEVSIWEKDDPEILYLYQVELARNNTQRYWILDVLLREDWQFTYDPVDCVEIDLGKSAQDNLDLYLMSKL